MNDYENFKKYVKNKAGIDLSLYQGTDNTLPVFSGDVYIDQASGRTFFCVNVGGENVVGSFEGATSKDKHIARLIIELANGFFAAEELSRTEFFKKVLKGETDGNALSKYSVKFNVPDLPCYAMIITSASPIADIKGVLTGYADGKADTVVDTAENECVLIKFCDKTSDDYRSQGEYAEYLRQIVYEELGAHINVYVGGKVKGLGDLVNSFVQAGVTKNYSSPSATGEVHTYNEYILLGIIEELPKSKIKEYLDVVMDENAREIFDDEEMVYTAEEFLNNSLNVSETSRTLYVHRNTLNYRLDKIEKATGLNIRKFADAVTFRLIIYLRKLVK